MLTAAIALGAVFYYAVAGCAVALLVKLLARLGLVDLSDGEIIGGCLVWPAVLVALLAAAAWRGLGRCRPLLLLWRDALLGLFRPG